MKKFIGFNKSLIEIGSGTCQLANYLAVGTNNQVYAFDSSFNSLKLGKNFADKNNIEILNLLEVIFLIKTFKMKALIIFGVTVSYIIQKIHMKHLSVWFRA